MSAVLRAPKRELEQAIKSAGSIKAAAHELEVSASTVRRWRRDGVPRKGDARIKIARYKDRRKTGRSRAASELKKLKQLLREAREIAGDAIAPVRSYDRKMDGRRAAGYQWVKAWNRELTLDLIDDVEKWTRGHRKRWPIWLAKFRFAQFSAEENFAFPTSARTVEVMVDDPARNSFMAEQIVPSPYFKSRKGLLDFMRDTLEDMVATGSTIFMLTSELYNYRWRTEQERRTRETEYRRKRESARKRRDRRRPRTR